MTNNVASFATVDPFDGMTADAPAQLQNLVGGEWVSDSKTMSIVDPLNGARFVEMPDTQDVTPFVVGLKSCPKTGLHNPLKSVERYVELGRVCAKAAALMAEQDVADFFAKLIQRVMPKSWAQCRRRPLSGTRLLEPGRSYRAGVPWLPLAIRPRCHCCTV